MTALAEKNRFFCPADPLPSGLYRRQRSFTVSILADLRAVTAGRELLKTVTCSIYNTDQNVFSGIFLCFQKKKAPSAHPAPKISLNQACNFNISVYIKKSNPEREKENKISFFSKE
ncbi:MAG: hypothetical protein IKC65_01450 [Lentisphaeria bacterium]|nr:hypothetical protein [Lentisphaeria bacterium]